MPRPRKKQDGKITTVYLERWALEKITEISKETGLSLGDLIEIWLTKEERIARMVAEYEGLKKRVLELEKLVMTLEDRLLKTEQQKEKALLERDALREENRQLKAELSELKKQLRMSARERRAESFKEEIHEVIRRYGKDGSIKMLELLKRLGYSSNFDQHARDLLEQWFVDEGYKLVSEELGLVVEKVHGLGRLAWKVKLADSFRFFQPKEEVMSDV